MKSHFMISECDGALYDTRVPNWSAKPMRQNYSRGHTRIKTVADLKATIRHGEFAFPGGYPLYFVTSDGASLSFETARAEFQQIADSIRHGINDGWRIVACVVNYEDSELVCAHSGKPIDSAYGESA